MAKEREIPAMNTFTGDNYKRVRIPDAKPQPEVFAYSNDGDSSFTLTVVKTERKQAFPRGRLLPPDPYSTIANSPRSGRY